MSSRMWLTRISRRRFLRRSPPFFVAYALTACDHTAQRSRLSQVQTLPQEPLNERDFLFEPALLMTMQETAEEKLENKLAHFDFVIG